MSGARRALGERQTSFMRAILDDGAPMPESWGNSHTAGMAVYRGNYRHALMSALAHTFERTSAYVGEDAFRQVSINHAIAHPPVHWTVDAVGEGFDATCAAFFRDNPEVAELAWLEWTMLELAGAPDCEPLSAEAFAQMSAGFDDEEWMGLTLTMLPRAAARLVEHDLEKLWRSLDQGGAPDPGRAPDGGALGCIAWREGERPTFLTVEAASARAFAAMRDGANYGELVALLAGDDPDDATIEDAAMRAGGFLGQWLQQGMIAAIGRQHSEAE